MDESKGVIVFLAEMYYDSYEPTHVIGIYTTLELAQKNCQVELEWREGVLEWQDWNQYREMYNTTETCRITEYELDK